MTNYTELCEILRTKLHGTIKLNDGSIQLADIVAADVIEELQAKTDEWRERHNEAARNWQEAARCVANLEAENSTLRNELCQKCGLYRDAHNGACNGCRWRVDNE